VHAHIGDRLVFEGTHLDQPRRIGIISEIRGPSGAPPYLVRWPDGHETLVFPGVDAHVEPAPDGVDQQ